MTDSTRPMLVGQAPARTTEGRGAFEGPSGVRLAGMLGVTLRELLGAADRVNLLDHYPGAHPTAPSGDAFPVDEGRVAAAALMPGLAGRDVLLAGRAVASCFRVAAPYFEWREHEAGFSACVIPHPSGASRYWNDPTRRRFACARLLGILGLVPAQKEMF